MRFTVFLPPSLVRDYRNVRMSKCQNVKMSKCWNVEMSKCQNVEMSKCGNDEMSKCGNVQLSKCGNVEISKCRKIICYVVVGHLGALDYQNRVRHVNFVLTAGSKSILNILVKPYWNVLLFRKFRKGAHKWYKVQKCAGMIKIRTAWGLYA